MALNTGVRLLRSAALEYLEYDATILQQVLSLGGVAAAAALWGAGQDDRAFTLASRIHRSGHSSLAARVVEQALRTRNLRDYFDAHIARSVRRPDAAQMVANPSMLFGYRALVTKRARDRERGVLVLDYSYIFPMFAALFDIEAIAKRYHIVLEPSWRGLCTADVLAYSRLDFPVMVQTIEPRDVAFVKALRSNLTTVPIAANWWIDHRLIQPVPAAERDIDVVVVASWSAVKRHWRLFHALARLRRRGHRLRVALVGYPSDKTRAEIEAEARYFGVDDQIEIHERVSLAEVGALYARSKVHVLWSRKEGANRAVIESLFADVPVVVRRGLSYGYHYPYINDQTGAFADEEELGDVLLDVIANRNRYRPREWAMANMTCQRATEILEQALREQSRLAGEPWTEGLAVKVSRLETQGYWNPDDGARFREDYAFLEAQVRAAYRR